MTYVQYQITPDRSVDNRKVHDMFRAISAFYAAPLDVIRRKKTAGAFWWDIVMTAESISFYATFPTEWQRELRKQIDNTWPNCAIESVDTFETILPPSASVCEMKYRRNNIFALQTDRRVELEPLQSIMSITSEMETGDVVRLSICAEPISRLDWQDYAERQFRTFKSGKTPRRTRISKRDILVSIGEGVTGLLEGALDTVHSAIGPEPDRKSKSTDDYEKRLIMIDGNLTRGTLNKIKAPTFNVHIRIASYSNDKERQTVLLRSVGNSFNDITADNELERSDVYERLRPLVLRELNEYQTGWLTRLDVDKNVMSNEELGRLVEMPTAALQDAYSDRLRTLDTRQIRVPDILTGDGIRLGDVPFKKQFVSVYIPTNDYDQLCLPTGVIGGMGSGKTKGFACNRAIEFVRKGYSALMVDPAKSEMWEQIEAALPENQRRRILLGHDVISLDFREALRSDSGRARLAQIILAFFEDNADTAGAQTQRYLRAAVMGMKTGKLVEILRIFTDKRYRSGIISALPANGMHRQTLTEFDGYSPDRQRQILAPIMNRLDVVLGDPYLERCMNADSGLDFVDILSHRCMCTVIDVPDRLNTRLAKDVLISLISFKIDAAMALRTDEFPYAIIYDEPHQYMRSAKLWANVAVESRKYRLAYTWLFHSWEQIPDSLAQIIRDAGPHYVIYPSSKKTYSGLREEIAPFTVEDGLSTKRYHAICALKIGDGRLTPFMCRMTPPVKR